MTSPHLRKKGKLFFLGVKLHHKQVSLIPSRVSISSTSENQLFFLFRECIFGGILGYFTLSTFQFDPPPEFVLLLHIFEIPAANLGRRIRETTLMGFSELLRLKTSGARQNAHRISIVAFSFPVFCVGKISFTPSPTPSSFPYTVFACESQTFPTEKSGKTAAPTKPVRRRRK